mmetsp:Transcript_37922/g.112264  ORF Transcript_37922/g.112264 Transcript_37922/m.112264 type:complete len:104 (-) Transcript_37922:128-439(-)
MFCMFTLLKPDVMPCGDLGVRRGVLQMYGGSRTKNIKDEAKRVRELSAHWAPYRSVGAMYMWRTNDKKAEDRQTSGEDETKKGQQDGGAAAPRKRRRGEQQVA